MCWGLGLQKCCWCLYTSVAWCVWCMIHVRPGTSLHHCGLYKLEHQARSPKLSRTRDRKTLIRFQTGDKHRSGLPVQPFLSFIPQLAATACLPWELHRDLCASHLSQTQEHVLQSSPPVQRLLAIQPALLHTLLRQLNLYEPKNLADSCQKVLGAVLADRPKVGADRASQGCT